MAAFLKIFKKISKIFKKIQKIFKIFRKIFKKKFEIEKYFSKIRHFHDFGTNSQRFRCEKFITPLILNQMFHLCLAFEWAWIKLRFAWKCFSKKIELFKVWNLHTELHTCVGEGRSGDKRKHPRHDFGSETRTFQWCARISMVSSIRGDRRS